jgi:hypothetical protein
MSVMSAVGSFAGKSAAYAWEGTRLASSQFAHGAAEGYVAKATELRAKREALTADAPAKPVAQRPLKPQRA